MTLQQAIAVVMILGSSLLTAWASSDLAFPAILCILGLLGVQRRFAWDLRPERHFITPLLLLVLAALFSLHCHYAHVHSSEAAAFAWQTIARYFLASMTLLLFLRPHRRRDGGWTEPTAAHPQSGWPRSARNDAIRNPQSPVALPQSLGLFHLGNALAAGQVLLLDDRYIVFRLAELLSVTLVILYAAAAGMGNPVFQIREANSKDRNAVAGRSGFEYWIAALVARLGWRDSISGFPAWGAALLLVVVNLGWIGGSVLYRHVETINFLPAWLSRGVVALETTGSEVAHVGFSTSGRLSNVLAIKEDVESAPVLTITGDNNPMYLRAMSFETYHQSSWHDLSYREAIGPEQNTPFGVLMVGRTNLFRLHGQEAPREVFIHHEAGFGDAMFTPLGPSAVEAPLSLLMRDDDDIISSPSARSRLSYRIAYGPAGRGPSGSQSRRMLAIPTELDLSVRAKAVRIFRDCTTTAQKIEAVTRYFHTNYTYALGLEVPPGRDALNYFLLEASTGYCEYFASGAAILLRLAGVPTRYVTGFLVTEQGDDRRTWVARNSDAHAWAEAWDAEEGRWVIVEATTQAGLGDVSLADELAKGAADSRPLLTRLAESLYEYGLFGVLGPLWDVGGRGVVWLAAGILFVAAALVLAYWKKCHAAFRQAGTGGADPRRDALVMLHRLLATLDRKARGLGYRRRPGETLHAFAVRLVGGDRDDGGRYGPRQVSQRVCENGWQPQTQLGDGLSGERDLPEQQVQIDRAMGETTGLQIKLDHLSSDDFRRAVNLADWYLQYAGLRYCRALDPAQVEQLCRLIQDLSAGR